MCLQLALHMLCAQQPLCHMSTVAGSVFSPAQGGVFQHLFYIHIITAVVCDDDTEIGVPRDPEQLLHVRNELQYPTCLVFHWLAAREQRGAEEKQRWFHDEFYIQMNKACSHLLSAQVRHIWEACSFVAVLIITSIMSYCQALPPPGSG